ncbi:MAG: hypothetical protein HRU12_05210 [Phaeodactylibacter sp.]|nr:hypothetical protein [Phaeodactylibacter sp.]
MKIRWCWRCELEIPMLDQEEFQLCELVIGEGRKLVEEEIEKRNIQDYKWLGTIPKSHERLSGCLEV